MVGFARFRKTGVRLPGRLFIFRRTSGEPGTQIAVLIASIPVIQVRAIRIAVADVHEITGGEVFASSIRSALERVVYIPPVTLAMHHHTTRSSVTVFWLLVNQSATDHVDRGRIGVVL